MKRCKRCDITYTDEHRFCGRCGAELEAVASEGESRAHSRRGVVAVAVTAIAAVAAVAVAAIVFLGPKTDGVPVTLVVSVPGQERAADVPLVVRFEGTTEEGRPESRDLVFAPGRQPRIPAGTYRARPVASPIFDDGSIYAVPEAIEVTVNSETKEGQQQEQPAIEFSRRLCGVEVTDEMIDASLKMMGEAGCEQSSVDEAKAAAAESRAAGIPGNTSGNIVNGGRAVESEKGAYYLANEYSEGNAGQSPHGVNGHIYSTADGTSSQEVYNQAGAIYGLNHIGGKFCFFEWMPGDPEDSQSLVLISDNFDLSTRQKLYTASGYIDSLNATTEYAIFVEANDGIYSVRHIDFSSNKMSVLYTGELISSLSVYGSYLYFLAGDAASNRGCTRVVRTDSNGQNETVLYTSSKPLKCLNVGPEGLTFAERDDTSYASTVRRLQLDGTDIGTNVELEHSSIGGLNVSGGYVYTLTSDYFKNKPLGLDYLSVLDLQAEAGYAQKLEKGGNARDLCIAAGHAFYEGGYAVDDEEMPPVPLPDSSNMGKLESPIEGQSDSYHVVTPDYEFDIPEYWRGKVEYETGQDKNGYFFTHIYLAGQNEKDSFDGYKYQLAYVSCTPASMYSEEEGDIGGHKVLTVNSGEKYVSVWTKCWPFYAWHNTRSTGSNSEEYETSLTAELVDLSTGGTVSYEEATQSQNSGVSNEANFNHDEFEKTLRVVD